MHAHHGVHAQKSGPSAQDRYCARSLGGGATSGKHSGWWSDFEKTPKEILLKEKITLFLLFWYNLLK